MTTTITDGTTTITPDLVLGWSSDSSTANISHKLAVSRSISVTLVGDGKRTGSMKLFFWTAADCAAARSFFSTASVFTLASGDITQIGMHFVRAGTMSDSLNDATLSGWTLTVGFQEV